jgi:type I restriction enzyme, S subunit
MREDWQLIPFGELCDLTRGHNPPKSKFINEEQEGYVRFYQIRDGWSDAYKVYVPESPQLHTVLPDDMLMVAYRHIGKVFRGVTGAFNVALCKISNSSTDILDNDFLFYMIPTEIIKGELMKKSERSLIPSMSVQHLKSLQIPIPPLEEQKQIVALLDKAFEAIDKAKANIEQNIINAKELFQSKLNEIFSQKGDGWAEKTLGELGTLTSSKRIFKKEYVSDGVPFYRSKEVKELGNNKEISLELFITEERYQEIKQKYGIPQKGDILLTAVGTIGEMYIVHEDDKFYFKDGNIMWLKDFEALKPKFLKYSLTYFVEQLKAISRGSAYSALTIEKLKKHRIPVPNEIEQDNIVQSLDSLKINQQALLKNYSTKLLELEELKKSILQKAFTGELTAKM